MQLDDETKVGKRHLQNIFLDWKNFLNQGIKSGAQIGAVPGVSTQVVVEPLRVLACFDLQT